MAYPIRRFIDLLKKKLKNRHVLFNIIKFYFSFFITKSIFQYYFSKPFCKIHVKPFHIYFSLLQYGADFPSATSISLASLDNHGEVRPLL